MKLHNLLPPYGKKHKVKRVGRGDSSGMGNTSGRGNPGEKSRSGRVHYLGFEGGQMPLYRRLPKRGFTSLAKERYQEVNLCSLNNLKDEKEVTPEILHKRGLIKKVDGKIKILGNGTIETALVIRAHKFSAKAKEEIVKKGGKVIEIETPLTHPMKGNKLETKVRESIAEKEEKIKQRPEELKVAKPKKEEEKVGKKPKAVKQKESVKTKDKTKGKKKNK